jgi:hypothetical protein
MKIIVVRQASLVEALLPREVSQQQLLQLEQVCR